MLRPYTHWDAPLHCPDQARSQKQLNIKPPPIPDPSHWGALLGNIAIREESSRKVDRSRVSFDIYAWGRKMRVDIAKKSFENYLWAAMARR